MYGATDESSGGVFSGSSCGDFGWDEHPGGGSDVRAPPGCCADDASIFAPPRYRRDITPNTPGFPVS